MKTAEMLREMTSDEAKLTEFYNTHIKNHTFEEYAFGRDCEDEIADTAGKIIEDALSDAPEQIPYMDPLHSFSEDDVIEMIARREYITVEAVVNAIQLVKDVREYMQMHREVYGCEGSVMLS